MKALILIAAGPLLLGPAGYFLGKMMAPPPAVEPAEEQAPAEAVATPKEILYKMPLGKITIQVMQPKDVLHIVVDFDVFIAGAAEFERLNGANGRSRLRDATISIVSDMAESTLWVEKGEEENLDRTEMSAEIVRKLHREFASIRTAQINEMYSARSMRK